jgi:phage terminase large subunit-like protein
VVIVKQDGINCHVGIIDEYHAHKDDTVKENLESSTVQRTQALIYHITTVMCNRLASDTRNQLSRNIDNSLWIMIHDIDQEDLAEQSWENALETHY